MTLPKDQLLAKRKGGFKKQYDHVKIAAEMIDWSRHEDSINIAQFCSDRGYLPSLIWTLEQEFDEFAEAYILTRLKLAERRERLMNANKLNYGAWQRYQRGYDPFLAKDEDEKEDKDADRRKGVVQSEQMNLVMLAKLAAQGMIKQKD